MNSREFYSLITQQFPFTPTLKQEVVLKQLSDFILSNNPNDLYVLKGYAGTGKTTIISTVVSNLWKIKKSAVLMAPTGRAAKVIANYSKKEAFTIHKKIYFPKKSKNGGISFVLQPNRHKDTVFIVDEASMIPDIPGESRLFENGSLLDDLMQYVYSGHRCKLLLIGDTAQLPPVKLDISPALEVDKLELNYNKKVSEMELDQVVRQQEESGILGNATQLREQLQQENYKAFKFQLNGYQDIVRLIDGEEIMGAINDAYSQLGNEETAIIVRSNKRANLYNQSIRERILFNENELTAGDYLMVVKNNYFWIKPTTEAGFIANGDIVEVLEIFRFEDLYGFRFAHVKVRMVDYPRMRPFETVLLLNTISAESPSLSYEDSNRLYQEVMKDYETESSNYRKFLKVKNNNYFNALQVKFSYAITCHKSQGGQWHTVFVEQPYLPNGVDRDYLRWLYTAVTRATNKLYLIGFKDDNFEV
ncbi:MAG TPA: AAA family ATPase [Flavobacteriaceae bacterium]|nr:AAA family ATPase [Flavobacteriaceae bacterium]